jgi:DNA polymerase-3 subunit beta
MKATIERATLLKSLGHVQSVVERRNTIPILSNVMIEATEEGGIRLMATDLDLQINETVPANVTQAGATTVSAHTLFDIARKLPEGSQVELSASEGKMQINAGRARFNLSTLPRDDFPVIAEGDLPTRFELPAATLRQIIDKTRFAISTEETRYYLNGIYLHVTDEAQPLLRAAATDGHRSPASPCPARRRRGHAGRDHSAQMRRRAPQAARRVDGTVQVSLVGIEDPLRPRQRGPDVQADRRTFPDYSRGHPHRERQAPAHRSARVRGRGSTASPPCQREDAAPSRWRWIATEITLSGHPPETAPPLRRSGDYAADGFEIGFNARYLLDILCQIEAITVEVHLRRRARSHAVCARTTRRLRFMY